MNKFCFSFIIILLFSSDDKDDTVLENYNSDYSTANSPFFTRCLKGQT